MWEDLLLKKRFIFSRFCIFRKKGLRDARQGLLLFLISFSGSLEGWFGKEMNLSWFVLLGCLRSLLSQGFKEEDIPWLQQE
jgi:hypothetical protein